MRKLITTAKMLRLAKAAISSRASAKRPRAPMARTSAPHSATAQFFINTVDNGFLDYPGSDGWGYAVFGKVTQGMDVVDAIADQPTGIAYGMRNVPKETILIEKVTVSE